MRTKQQPLARVTLRWECLPYSRDIGEEFADVEGVGRYAIRRQHQSKNYELRLNGEGLTSSTSASDLREAALLDVVEKMREE